MTSDAPTREYCKKSWKGKPREVLNVAVVAGRVDTVRLGHPWAANPVELRDWSSGMTDPSLAAGCVLEPAVAVHCRQDEGGHS